jgi:predicted nucleic acid-binding protein
VKPPVCVVDASVAAMLFLSEPLSERAHALFDGLAAARPSRLHVPDFFYIEVAHVLLKHVRRAGYVRRQAAEDLECLLRLALRPTRVSLLAQSALAMAMEYGLSAYDASYVALSDWIGAPLVTADQRLLRALAASPYQALWLGDIAIE